MGYQILMLEASNEYQNNRWLAYDRRFRQLATSQPSSKWSNTDSTLWSLAFTGQAKVNRCKHCFSLFHQSIDCEFASSSTSSSRDQCLQRFTLAWPVKARLQSVESVLDHLQLGWEAASCQNRRSYASQRLFWYSLLASSIRIW